MTSWKVLKNLPYTMYIRWVEFYYGTSVLWSLPLCFHVRTIGRWLEGSKNDFAWWLEANRLTFGSLLDGDWKQVCCASVYTSDTDVDAIVAPAKNWKSPRRSPREEVAGILRYLKQQSLSCARGTRFHNFLYIGYSSRQSMRIVSLNQKAPGLRGMVLKLSVSTTLGT